MGTSVSATILLGAIIVAGCGSTSGSTFGDAVGSSGGGGGGSSGNLDDGVLPGLGGSSGGTKPCQGLQCQQVACEGGKSTSLTGKVYDPSGTVPLYNAVVYVPNEELAPFSAGVTCDRCGTAPSGKPIATALTDATGSFTLKNVPVGVDVPLVVQIGRWRRKVVLPAQEVARCEERPLSADVTRLPRSQAEGDIPKIAITTGNADSLECFVRKLGLDPAEFTNPAGTGRVNLFQGLRAGNNGQRLDGSRVDASTPSANALWDDVAQLKRYDMVILSCEGAENLSTKSATARQNLSDYLDAGGRVFASHFHYAWFKAGPGKLPQTASWVSNSDAPNQDVTVDASFAKGVAFRDWLQAVQATTTPGVMPMTELRRNVTTVPAAGADPETSRRWLYATPGGAEETKFFSFNAPVAAPAEQQCGRGVYTDIHVSSGDASGGTFPANCTTTGFTPQEKALLFLLMDLASCIQDDSEPPQAPPIVN